jgi:hypothetical protein
MVLGGITAVLLVLAALAAFSLVTITRDLNEARRLITSAGEALERGEISTAELQLAEAADRLVAANNRLHSSVALELVGWLPLVSNNLDVVEESVGLAMQIALGGRELLAASGPLQAEDGRLEIPLADGAIPLDAVRAAQGELGALAAVLPTADELPDGDLLVPPVREARADLYEEASRRRDQADVLSRGLDVILEMSGGNGSRRYLIAVANTAEMRGSGGMILSYGVLTGSRGDFGLEEFGRIDELALAEAVPRDDIPQVPRDYLDRWEGFDPLLRWRNATLAADFELTAPVLEAMYEQATGDPVDGVIQIDPDGLAAVLEGTGPVIVPELGEVGADNVVDVTLSEAYARFPDIEDRSDVLGDVAEATFQRLVDGDYQSLRPLAEALGRAVEGRHIQVHTPIGSSLSRLRSFGATGTLPQLGDGDVFHLTVQNLSGHKLDYYLDTALTVEGSRPVGTVGRVDARITLTNGAPPGRRDPAYVFVPFDPEQSVGSYRGAVSLYLPRGTSLVELEGEVLDGPVVATEGGRPVVSFTTDVAAGERREIVLSLELPPAPSESPLQLIVPASPRVRPTTFIADIETHAGDLRGELVLDRTWVLHPGRRPDDVRIDD